MKLEFVDRKEKEIEGTRYVRNIYTIDEYTVFVDDAFYKNGTSRHSIDVQEPGHFSGSYLPHIYYRDSLCGEKVSVFEVQTTSYGALDVAEFQKFLAAQQKALEAVEILTREFCGEGALAK